MGMTFVIIGGGFDLSVGSTVGARRLHRRHGDAGSSASPPACSPASRPAPLSAWSTALIIAYLKVNPFITTLGTMVLFRGVVFLDHRRRSGRATSGLPVELSSPSARSAFSAFTAWSGCRSILLVVLSCVMHATPYGRRIYATGGDREAAYLSGVPVDRIIASTYVICGALAGVAGVMLAARLQSGPADRGRILRTDRHRRRGAGRRGAAWRRRHALQERDRRLHHDHSGQQPQSAQCRFLLAACRRRRCHHCRSGGG